MSDKKRKLIIEGLEVRSSDTENESPKIAGYASVFDKETVIAGLFREVIKAGAFTRALNEKHDVRALVDHDPSKILGRTKSNTLTLREDKKGLYVEIEPPETQLGKDIVRSIARGDVDQMSFGFIPRKTTWREDADNDIPDLREIEDLDLFDVSVVTYPAYEDTEVSVRSAEEILESENPKKQEVNLLELQKQKLRLVEIE